MQLVPEFEVQVFCPGVDVTVYLVIEAPFVCGFCQLTATFPFPRTPTTLDGAVGTDDGMTVALGPEGGPSPTLLVARTRSV